MIAPKEKRRPSMEYMLHALDSERTSGAFVSKDHEVGNGLLEVVR